MKAICVFCGSSFGTREAYAGAARDTGRLIAEQGYTLVYGGARVGLMGTVADAALDAGGKVIGVLPKASGRQGNRPRGSDRTAPCRLHARAQGNDGGPVGCLHCLPGGVGTLEEIFEVWTWGQLGYHQKPCGFLNIDGYYDDLIRFLDHQTDQGFTKDVMRTMVQIAGSPQEMIGLFENYTPPSAPKWIKRDET